LDEFFDIELRGEGGEGLVLLTISVKAFPFLTAARLQSNWLQKRYAAPAEEEGFFAAYSSYEELMGFIS